MSFFGEEKELLNVLVIGNGGREHTLAWKLAQSEQVGQVYVSKGNGGTSQGNPKIQNLALDPNNFPQVIQACRERGVGLVMVGPEDPLANGISDALKRAGVPVFGPSKRAAQIEASKAFAKDFMKRHNIPTARYENFHEFEPALAYVHQVDHPIVIKASGLAAGKGVILPQTKEEAEVALRSIMLDREFGTAGDEVVIEELLIGEEASCMAFTDGHTVVMLPAAQDHKRVFDNDQGPNTGGMGAYAPAPVATPAVLQQIKDTVLQPAVDGLRREGIPFVGILYAGIMLTANGPYVLEFNCRFGDPETEVLLPLLETDLVTVLKACVEGCLDAIQVKFKQGYAATIVAASPGYPGKYPQNLPITGIENAHAKDPRIQIFHAGTKLNDDGVLVTSGGRVLMATATGSTFEETLRLAYAGIGEISFEGMHYRRDIGHRAIRHFANQGQRLRVAVLGSTRGSAWQPVLDAWKAGRLPNVSFDIAMSDKADAPILERARQHGIEAVSFSAKGRKREEVDAEVSAVLQAKQIDLILLIGYMRIISAPFVQQWRNRIMNVHPSLLPAFAGGMDLQVHRAVIEAGVPESGCTIHYVDEGVDSGPIVVQKRCAVEQNETPESLKAKVQALEGQAFLEAIEVFAREHIH